MISIVIVALIHIGIGYALVTGLAISAAKQVIQRVTTVDIEEPEPEEEEPPPPPPEENVAPPPPVAPPAPINIAPAPPPIRTVDTPPPPAPIAVRVPPPAAAPPPPPAPSRARAAQREGQNRWAARIQANYPRRAVQREIEGNVGVSVTIGPDGRVTGCSVSNSSGNDDLDQAACEGMQRYARYEPALDDAGNPTTGRDSMTIVYRLGE